MNNNPSPKTAALQGSVSIRPYLSIHHAHGAAHLCRLAHGLELSSKSSDDPDAFMHHRAYVIGSLLSSVACLEAAINEVFADAADAEIAHRQGLDERTIDLLARIWNGVLSRRLSYTILEKYECALDLAAKAPFDKGARPYQDVDRLIQLRNALVHYKPDSHIAGGVLATGEIHSIERILKGSFSTNPYMADGNPFFPDRVLSHGCAKWAAEGVFAFVTEFSRRMGLTPAFEVVRAKLELQ
jgi:hypothetical protein